MTNTRLLLFGLGGCAFAGLAHIFVHSLIGTAGVILIFYAGSALWGRFFAPARAIAAQLFFGLSAMLALLMLATSGLYYVFEIHTSALFAILLIILLAGAWGARHGKEPTQEKAHENFPRLIALFILACLAVWWFMLFTTQVDESIRSVWNAISPLSLIPLGLGFGLLALTKMKQRFCAWHTLLGLTVFSGLAIASIVYTYGYGFDPFIHRASMMHIAEFGTIEPKTLYYIGAYGLELTLAQVFALPLYWVDALSAPVLFALFAILGTYMLGQHHSLWRAGALAVLLLPLWAFIQTTPQAIAYIITLALVCGMALYLMDKQKNSRMVAWGALLALCSMVIHPLAGIPATVFYGIALLSRAPYARVTVPLAGVSSGFILPLVFFVQSWLADLPLSLSWNSTWNDLGLQVFLWNRFNTLFDALYLVLANHLWIALAFAGAGVIIMWKHEARSLVATHLWASAGTLLSFLLLSLVLEFSFLIEYERRDYALRMLVLTMIFLFPLMLASASLLAKKLSSTWKPVRIVSIVLIGFVGAALVYGAYPRHDNYARSAGFSVGTADFSAVKAIEAYAQETPYIVLANQATSAAAVQTYGFANYYKEDIFYYPIPTGGRLYQQYLNMVEQTPTRDTIQNAGSMAGVNLVFLAVSQYWWEYDRIVEQTKPLADDWFALEDGAITVFVFQLVPFAQ